MAAMLGYLVQRESSLGPLFKFADGRRLTRDCFVSSLRSALGECGIDPSLYVCRSQLPGGGSDDCSFSRHAGLPHKDVRSLG